MGILTILAYLPLKTPVKMFIVLSGSMNPAIPAGSVVLVQSQGWQLQKGDIITFIHPTNPAENVTHRIIGIDQEKNSFSYRTKGDANNLEDLWTIRKEAVWGKVGLSLPYLGYFLNFSKTKLGVMGMIVLPLLLIALTEIMVIIKEVKRLKNTKIDLPNIKLD